MYPLLYPIFQLYSFSEPHVFLLSIMFLIWIILEQPWTFQCDLHQHIKKKVLRAERIFWLGVKSDSKLSTWRVRCCSEICFVNFNVQTSFTVVIKNRSVTFIIVVLNYQSYYSQFVLIWHLNMMCHNPKVCKVSWCRFLLKLFVWYFFNNNCTDV